jgi:oligopeptide transport system ATP-binding protein
VTPLLEVSGLSITLTVDGEVRQILSEVSIALPAGAALGLVGESGSGKSMTARAVTRLLPKSAVVTSGSVCFDGTDVNGLRGQGLAAYRRHGVAFVPQDPSSSINPVHTVGDFLTESMRIIDGRSGEDARRAARESLAEVGISDPDRCLEQYPHQLSGGMLQRVFISAALLAKSRLVVADEPTTALDVTTQAEVVAILNDLRREHDLALLFITHDLELAAAVCDRIAVMYAGEIVEEGDARLLESAAAHPYTQGLFAARPSLDLVQDPLPAIPGRARSAFEVGAGCAFADRCSWVEDECRSEHPELTTSNDGFVRCLRAMEIKAALSPGGVGQS